MKTERYLYNHELASVEQQLTELLVKGRTAMQRRSEQRDHAPTDVVRLLQVLNMRNISIYQYNYLVVREDTDRFKTNHLAERDDHQGQQRHIHPVKAYN